MLTFHKYVAAGNDFIIIDNWNDGIHLSSEQIIRLCDRRFGIGADGVLLLGRVDQYDFRMNYFNADGSRGEMCGNGARALVKFAESLGKIESSGSFLADDGSHQFKLIQNQVELEILVNDELRNWEVPTLDSCFINTGVPHIVSPVNQIHEQDLLALGEAMNQHPSHPKGTNLNLIEHRDGSLYVRTWERGVNTETLACGTGAAAAAIYAHEVWETPWPVSLSFKGGELKVDHRKNQYWLQGDAELVFIGQFTLSKI
jgi:diaminopimelate epimerase